MDAEEMFEWSLYFKVKAEQEKEAMLREKAQQKLQGRSRGGLRRGRN